MAEPEFTTRGKKVRVAGNTNEKTNCGKIEVYEDRIKIQQKGVLMSKGWITVRFDNIVDIQKSSLGKMTFMTNRQDVSVTGLGGPTTIKITEQIADYLETKTNRNQSVSSSNSNADEIAKFAKLKAQGVISEEEFQKKKDELL